MSFAVPEYGILFRCAAEGTHADLEIIAFLSFLRFVEHNKDIFKNRELHIFTDFPPLAYLMDKQVVANRGMEAVLRQAQKSAKGIIYKVMWIDTPRNRAAGPVGSIPNLPEGVDLKIKTFPALGSKMNPSDPADELIF
ncbi:MAG: hypothetical protein GY841_21130 [FCB group bacterium]|nr:hypothetical protein [FCB group bacterium]